MIVLLILQQRKQLVQNNYLTKTIMRTLITIIATAVGISALWLLTLRYRPMWIVNIMLDANGFPKIKKEGDKFTLFGKNYTYTSGVWVFDESGGPNPNGGGNSGDVNGGIIFDRNTGFPIAPTEGMRLIFDSVSYRYMNGSWINLSTGAIASFVPKELSRGTKCKKDGDQVLCQGTPS